MTEKIKILYYTLWVAHPLLELGVAAIMVQRGLHRKFKFFFGYVITQLTILRWSFPQTGTVIPPCFTCTGFAMRSVWRWLSVIHEVFVDVFRAFHTLRDLGTVLFRWAGLVMLLVAGVVSVSTNSKRFASDSGNHHVATMCAHDSGGDGVVPAFFAHYVGVSRRKQSFGIALGLARSR